jgi:hypothetical protein
MIELPQAPRINVLTWNVLAFVSELILLIWYLAAALHACIWPAEEVYGGYDHLFFVTSLIGTSLQAFSLIIVSAWASRKSRSIAARTFDAWESCGMTSESLPWFVDAVQAVAIVNTVLMTLSFFQIIIIVLGTFKLFCSMSMVTLLRSALKFVDRCVVKYGQQFLERPLSTNPTFTPTRNVLCVSLFGLPLDS